MYPSAAEPDGVDNFSSKGRALISHQNFVDMSVDDRLDQVLHLVFMQIYIIKSADRVPGER